MTYETTLLIFGILLLLIGLVGNVKAKELEIGTDSIVARTVIGIVGAVLIGLSLVSEVEFLSDNGVFRDVLLYVDLLVAQIYAAYIGVRGGAFLRADFTSPEDPMAHVRRMLGLDGVNPRSGRTRLKAVDGEARRLDDPKSLN